jgi:prevent-host-death family protein
MKTMSAKDAKNGFGRLIDIARAEPVTVEKHGRGVVVVMSVEEYQRLKAAKRPAVAPIRNLRPDHSMAHKSERRPT